MKFRPIEMEKDYEKLIEFRYDTHVQGHGTHENFDSEQYLARIRDRLDIIPEGQLMIEDNHQTIGQIGLLIQVYQGQRIGYVNLYYLIPEYRGKGLGKELVAYAERYFRKANVTEYHLRVSPNNDHAIKLYMSVGMKVVGEEFDSNQHRALRLCKGL